MSVDHPAAVVVDAGRRQVLTRRIRFLVAGTIGYNVIEAAVALTAGAQASSTALIGFGLDSVIEVTSAAAVAWQFSKPDHEAREKAALRIIALSFFALAAYVTVESLRALFGDSEPRPSIAGIVLAAVSLAVMPLLSWAQRRTGRELRSRSAVADSKQTLLCTYLSGQETRVTSEISDQESPVEDYYSPEEVREGLEAWKGRNCCGPAPRAEDPCGPAPCCDQQSH